MERQSLLKRMNFLHDQCFGCTKPPFATSGNDTKRSTWCRENCKNCVELMEISKELDTTATVERNERMLRNLKLPEHHFMQHIKNGPDVGASDPEFQEAL